MRALVLLALVASSPALAGKRECADLGEQLFSAQPNRATVEMTFRECRPLAEAGDGEAQYYVASVFFHKSPPDNPNVEMWMQRSAESGYGRAQFYMATLWRSGTSEQRKRALEWYEAAARGGVPPAPLELAKLYQYGGSTAVDGPKAVYWYEFAARQYRLTNAMHELVKIYSEGMEGVARDPAKAQYWQEQIERSRCPPARCG